MEEWSCNSTHPLGHTGPGTGSLYLFLDILNCLLIYPKEQSPSREANRFSASQENPYILWNPNVHYRSREYAPHVPLLSQLDPVHTPTSHFLKLHHNIILPSTPASSKWSIPLSFPHQRTHPPPLWRCGTTRTMASSFLRFLDHTQRRITVGRTPLDE